MIEVHTTDDISPALQEIIEELLKAGFSKHASMLNHRMTKVAWTSRDELFEELIRVLSDLETNPEAALPSAISTQLALVLKKMQDSIPNDDSEFQ